MTMNPIFMSVLKYTIIIAVVGAIIYQIVMPIYEGWKKKQEGKKHEK